MTFRKHMLHNHQLHCTCKTAIHFPDEVTLTWNKKTNHIFHTGVGIINREWKSLTRHCISPKFCQLKSTTFYFIQTDSFTLLRHFRVSLIGNFDYSHSRKSSNTERFQDHDLEYNVSVLQIVHLFTMKFTRKTCFVLGFFFINGYMHPKFNHLCGSKHKALSSFITTSLQLYVCSDNEICFVKTEQV